jgi:hypothetical protein
MLAQYAPSSQSPLVKIGIGIDTSRYGHYAAFLRAQPYPIAAGLQFVESAAGFAQLRQRFEQIVAKLGPIYFLVRLDAAGQYADNLLHFLRSLAAPSGSECSTFTISCGDPQRNKNYRAALFGAKKSDPVEARAAARYALAENPPPANLMSDELRTLRQVASRLQAVVRQRTRLVNQLHHLLALTFPELALLVNDIATGWVLELCFRYPTAKQLATASAADLDQTPYLPHKFIEPLLEQARTSIASLHDDAVAELVRDQIRHAQSQSTCRNGLATRSVRELKNQAVSFSLRCFGGLLGPFEATDLLIQGSDLLATRLIRFAGLIDSLAQREPSFSVLLNVGSQPPPRCRIADQPCRLRKRCTADGPEFKDSSHQDDGERKGSHTLRSNRVGWGGRRYGGIRRLRFKKNANARLD